MTLIFRLVQAALRRVAEACLVALALLTLTDVLGRYVFNVSVLGAVEMTELLMVGVIFTGIVLTTQRREHVAVDLLVMGLGPRGRRIQQVASDLLAVGISVLLAMVTWDQGRSALEFNEQTTMLGLPLAPMVFFMSAMLFLNAIVQVQQLWMDMTRAAPHD